MGASTDTTKKRDGPTPRTDKLRQSIVSERVHPAWVQHAEQLERELAREKLKVKIALEGEEFSARSSTRQSAAPVWEIVGGQYAGVRVVHERDYLAVAEKLANLKGTVDEGFCPACQMAPMCTAKEGCVAVSNTPSGVSVKCVGCAHQWTVLEGEVAQDDHPMCPKCSMPGVPDAGMK